MKAGELNRRQGREQRVFEQADNRLIGFRSTFSVSSVVSYSNALMVHSKVAAWCVAMAIGAMSLGGCGEPSETVSVHGHVTYQGEAVTNGSLTFFPESGRPIATPLTDAGQYAVELPPDQYDVAVSVGVTLPAGWKEGDPVPPPEITLPARYTTRAKSVLQATVAADQAEPVDFALE
jgi:hypothetical protein